MIIKTLEEFDCIHCNDKCDKFPCDAYTYHESHSVYSEELRKNIIEDIKEIKKNGFDIMPRILDMPVRVDSSLKPNEFRLDTRDVSRKLIQLESDLVVRYLMMKFNISEEDLL